MISWWRHDRAAHPHHTYSQRQGLARCGGFQQAEGVRNGHCFPIPTIAALAYAHPFANPHADARKASRRMTVAYFTLAALIAWAGWMRKRDALSLLMLAALAASLCLAQFQTWSALPYLGTIDALVCVGAGGLWAKHYSNRARIVGLIGGGKVAVTYVAYTIDPQAISWPYALFLNAAFMSQLVTAGGWADGLGIRVDRALTRIAPRGYSLFSHGKR